MSKLLEKSDSADENNQSNNQDENIVQGGSDAQQQLRSKLKIPGLAKSPQNDKHAEFNTRVSVKPQTGVIKRKHQLRQTQVVQVQQDYFKEMMVRIRMRKFIVALVQKTRARMLKILTPIHYTLLNDYMPKNPLAQQQQQSESGDSDRLNLGNLHLKRSSDGSYHRLTLIENFEEKIVQVKNCFKQWHLHQKFSTLMQKVPLFSPASTWRIAWDTLILFLLFFYVYFVPIQFAFGTRIDEILHSAWLVRVLAIIQFMDFLISLNSSYYEKGILVKNRTQIISNYVRHSFFTDILGSIVIWLTAFQAMDSSQWLLDSKIRNIINMFKLLINILMVSHLFACTWVFAHYLQIMINPSATTWMTRIYIDQELWYNQYIHAWYFSTVTMITVGYGDIVPSQQYEMLLSVANMMIACGFFGYFLNRIGIIVEDYYKMEEINDKKMYIINRYMNNKNVNMKLQYQIREYLEYYWRETSNENEEEEEKIIAQLSLHLREKLLVEANKIVLKDSPIFYKNFSDNVIQKTVPLITEHRAAPEQIIFLEGDSSDHAIYFIQKGSVELFFDATGPYEKQKIQRIQKLTKGNVVGTHSFFTGKARSVSVRSLEFTTLLVIKRIEFLDLLSQHKEDYERFCFIRDRLLIDQKQDIVSIACESCKSFDHNVQQCAFVHFIPNKFKTIAQHLQKTEERRLPPFEDRQRRVKYSNLEKLTAQQQQIQILRLVEAEAIEQYFIKVVHSEDYSFYLQKRAMQNIGKSQNDSEDEYQDTLQFAWQNQSMNAIQEEEEEAEDQKSIGAHKLSTVQQETTQVQSDTSRSSSKSRSNSKRSRNSSSDEENEKFSYSAEDKPKNNGSPTKKAYNFTAAMVNVTKGSKTASLNVHQDAPTAVSRNSLSMSVEQDYSNLQQNGSKNSLKDKKSPKKSIANQQQQMSNRRGSAISNQRDDDDKADKKKEIQVKYPTRSSANSDGISAILSKLTTASKQNPTVPAKNNGLKHVITATRQIELISHLRRNSILRVPQPSFTEHLMSVLRGTAAQQPIQPTTASKPQFLQQWLGHKKVDLDPQISENIKQIDAIKKIGTMRRGSNNFTLGSSSLLGGSLSALQSGARKNTAAEQADKLRDQILHLQTGNSVLSLKSVSSDLTGNLPNQHQTGQTEDQQLISEHNEFDLHTQFETARIWDFYYPWNNLDLILMIQNDPQRVELSKSIQRQKRAAEIRQRYLRKAKERTRTLKEKGKRGGPPHRAEQSDLRLRNSSIQLNHDAQKLSIQPEVKGSQQSDKAIINSSLNPDKIGRLNLEIISQRNLNDKNTRINLFDRNIKRSNFIIRSEDQAIQPLEASPDNFSRDIFLKQEQQPQNQLLKLQCLYSNRDQLENIPFDENLMHHNLHLPKSLEAKTAFVEDRIFQD